LSKRELSQWLLAAFGAPEHFKNDVLDALGWTEEVWPRVHTDDAPALVFPRLLDQIERMHGALPQVLFLRLREVRRAQASVVETHATQFGHTLPPLSESVPEEPPSARVPLRPPAAPRKAWWERVPAGAWATLGGAALTAAATVVVGVSPPCVPSTDPGAAGVAQSDPPILRGRVRTRELAPIAGALVQLDRCSDPADASTNSAGVYTFDELADDCASPPYAFVTNIGEKWHRHPIGDALDLTIPPSEQAALDDTIGVADVLPPGDAVPVDHDPDYARPYAVVWADSTGGQPPSVVLRDDGEGLTAEQRDRVARALPSVARIEERDGAIPYLSTGFLVSAKHILVPRYAIQRMLDTSDPADPRLTADLCARFDHVQGRGGACSPVTDVAYLHRAWDVALLELGAVPADARPLTLSATSPDPLEGTAVAVIGHPSLDTRKDLTLQNDYFKGRFGDKWVQPGTLRGMRKTRVADVGPVYVHDALTLAGNGGSPVLDADSGLVVGVQFASTPEGESYAVPTWSLALDTEFRSFDIRFQDDNGLVTGRVDPELAFRPLPYDPAFLGPNIPLPEGGPGSTEDLDYIHATFRHDPTRRLPIFAAVNVERASLASSRRGVDVWAVDPRVPPDAQAGPEVFRNNPLDRGHLVHRRATAWGKIARLDPNSVLRAAFYWPNATPQYAAFNRRRWHALERHILEVAFPRAERTRISLFLGPVFRKTDHVERGIAVPRSFWMVAVAKVDGRLRTEAYLLDQYVLSEDGTPRHEALPAIEVAHARVSVLKLQELTDLEFPSEVVEGDTLQ